MVSFHTLTRVVVAVLGILVGLQLSDVGTAPAPMKTVAVTTPTLPTGVLSVPPHEPSMTPRSDPTLTQAVVINSTLVRIDAVLDSITALAFPSLDLPFAAESVSKAKCVTKALRRLEYTHRRPRNGELSTIALRDAVKETSTYWWESNIPSVGRAKRVVGSPPVCFTPGVNLSRPFGSWHVSYFEVESIMSQRVAAKAPQVLEVEPHPYVGIFSPGLSSNGHTVSCGGTVVTTGGCLWDVRAPNPLPWTSAAKATVAVTLCDEWCKGYYHFSHEHLPRVASVHRLLVAGNATLVLSHKMNGFQRQFFVDVLGIPKIVEGTTTVADYTLHPTPMRCGNTFTMELHHFRSIVFERLKLNDQDGGDQLHVLFAERGKGSRMATNYNDIKAAVIERLRKHGVQHATTRGSEHVKDQIAMFHRASIVLGPHGANLANAMYMRRGGHLIEMASMAKGNMCYYSTALRVGLTFHFIPHLQGKDDPYQLDPAIVVQHVDAAINASLRIRNRG